MRYLTKSLAELRGSILGHYNNSEGKQTINSDWLKDFINQATIHKLEVPTSLLDYFDLYAEQQKGVISDELYEKIAPNRDRIVRFERYMCRKYQVKDVDQTISIMTTLRRSASSPELMMKCKELWPRWFE